MDTNAFRKAYRRELRRIGLREASSPYGGMASGSDEACEQFLAHLKSLPVGASWRDVHPDIPSHWDLDDESTWTVPYRPLGPNDYPAPPCGPAVMVHYPLDASDADLSALCVEAAAHGFTVYGSGFLPISNPSWSDRLAYVVLDVATTEQQFQGFCDWLRQYSTMQVRWWTRGVGQAFAPETDK